ncbi:hypothetical protein MMC10_010212 [Thelotrema lepadinum]|nr:hypothetical protein [Thelotrema lepadinum]
MFKRASPGNRTSKGEDATSEPLLDEENRLLNAWSTQDTEPATDYPRYRKYLSTAAKYCLVAVMGLMIATLAFPEVVIRLTQMMSFQPLSIPSKWSPLDASSIRWEVLPADPAYAENKLYMGEPSPEAHGMRINEYEMQRLGISDTIPLTGGGYATILGVYHNLHCLRRIHQYYFQDYYTPNMTAEVFNKWREHDLHCLEVLRRSVMCHPDLSVNTYYPSDNPQHAINVGMGERRECVNWDLLETATNPRKYLASEYPTSLFPA